MASDHPFDSGAHTSVSRHHDQDVLHPSSDHDLTAETASALIGGGDLSKSGLSLGHNSHEDDLSLSMQLRQDFSSSFDGPRCDTSVQRSRISFVTLILLAPVVLIL